MPLDEIAVLKLISELFLSIAGQLDKLKGTPKQRLATEIAELMHSLEAAGQDASDVVSSLNDFRKEKTLEMKVRKLQWASGSLREFGKSSRRFIRWVVVHKSLSNAMIILYPSAKQLLNELEDMDESGLTLLGNSLRTLQYDLQTVDHPDSKNLPTEKSISETIELFNQISSKIEKSKQLIRKFASESLSVEDFY